MNKETYLTEYPKHESMRENVKKDKNRLVAHCTHISRSSQIKKQWSHTRRLHIGQILKISFA